MTEIGGDCIVTQPPAPSLLCAANDFKGHAGTLTSQTHDVVGAASICPQSVTGGRGGRTPPCADPTHPPTRDVHCGKRPGM